MMKLLRSTTSDVITAAVCVCIVLHGHGRRQGHIIGGDDGERRRKVMITSKTSRSKSASCISDSTSNASNSISPSSSSGESVQLLTVVASSVKVSWSSNSCSCSTTTSSSQPFRLKDGGDGRVEANVALIPWKGPEDDPPLNWLRYAAVPLLNVLVGNVLGH